MLSYTWRSKEDAEIESTHCEKIKVSTTGFTKKIYLKFDIVLHFLLKETFMFLML